MTDRDNRELLNERFKTVFELLRARGEVVKNDRDKSMAAFAEKLLGSRSNGHIVTAYLREGGKRKITYEQAHRLCALYGVSEDYMFKGEGLPFEEELPLEASFKEELKEKKDPITGNILYSNIEAFASSTVSVDVYEESERFHIPGVQGEHVAFTINGDSMAPTIRDGDMVICQALESTEQLRENEIYAVVTSQAVMVKRVQKVYTSKGDWSHLKLISDNYIEHDPFTIDLSDVRRILHVERRLTQVES